MELIQQFPPGGSVINHMLINFLSHIEEPPPKHLIMPPPFLPPHIYDTKFTKHFIQISDGRRQIFSGQIRTHFHIFMITGNPGCIGYYNEFLSLLWDNLGAARNAADVFIYGTSMSGFTTDDDSGGSVLGLQEQIQFLEMRLGRYMDRHLGEEAKVEHKVVIIGHSVGAYIGLELIRRHQEKVKMGLDRGWDILGYVGLWPTVTHIGQSRRGRRIGVRCNVILVEVMLSLLLIVVIETAVLRLVHRSGCKSAVANPRLSLAPRPLEIDRLSGTGCSSDSRFSC